MQASSTYRKYARLLSWGQEVSVNSKSGVGYTYAAMEQCLYNFDTLLLSDGRPGSCSCQPGFLHLHSAHGGR